MNSALMVQDLKDAETNFEVVDLFKYSMVSICFHIRLRTNLTIYCLRQKCYQNMSNSICTKQSFDVALHIPTESVCSDVWDSYQGWSMARQRLLG